MKKLALLAIIAMSVVACDSMKGNLEVSNSLTLEKKAGFLGRKREEVVITEGKYEAVLNPTSKKNVNLVLKVEGKKTKIPFAIPEGEFLPDHGGEVLIVSADSGQPYDLKVKTSTTSSQSGRYTRTESCVLRYDTVYRCYNEPGETECRTVPSPTNCSRDDDGVVTCSGNDTRQVCHTRPGRQVCGNEQVAVYGSHQVDYVDVTTYKHVVASLLEGSSALAKFAHNSASTSSHSVGSSSCY